MSEAPSKYSTDNVASLPRKLDAADQRRKKLGGTVYDEVTEPTVA
jgi:hypothetical protein